MSAVVFGLGPLERYLADPGVNEIMVNGGCELWIERRAGGQGSCGPQHVGTLSPDVVEVIIERVLAPIGRRLDRVSPVVDARLLDGSRVCVVIPPIAVDGPCMAIRRFGIGAIPLTSFASGAVAALLTQVVQTRCNVLVSGATSAGKTTLLNALAGLIDPSERVITLEDTAELQLATQHVVRLETRQAAPDGAPAVDLAALVRAALRLRPDRLVIGEIRGDEAVDLVQAMNTGHDGSLATVHANSPIDALSRIESLVVRSSGGWPLDAVRAQVRRCIDVVVHVRRDATGARQVSDICEVDERELRTLVARGDVVAALERGRR